MDRLSNGTFPVTSDDSWYGLRLSVAIEFVELISTTSHRVVAWAAASLGSFENRKSCGHSSRRSGRKSSTYCRRAARCRSRKSPRRSDGPRRAVLSFESAGARRTGAPRARDRDRRVDAAARRAGLSSRAAAARCLRIRTETRDLGAAPDRPLDGRSDRAGELADRSPISAVRRRSRPRGGCKRSPSCLRR